MEVIITEWALQSYLGHVTRATFTDADYYQKLRPDVELLKTENYFDKKHPKFSNSKFWGPAKFKNKKIDYGYKMKWPNFGTAKIKFRLCIVIAETTIETKKITRAFLLNAYIKDDKTEKREMAKIKIKIRKILDGNYIYRGKL